MTKGGQRANRGGHFVEQTLETMVRKMERAFFAEDIAKLGGLLQRLDPRVKIVSLAALVIAATLSQNLFTIIFTFLIGVGLAVASRVPLRSMAKRVWLGAFVFTGIIAIPAAFTTPGDALLRLPVVGCRVTSQGAMSALYLIARVETTATLSLLLVLCTRWADVLKALRVLRVPVIFVVILGMTYRYIFVILETAQNMFEARKSRLIGRLSGGERRRLAVANVGVLLTKSFNLHSEVYLAMQSRGFRGEVYVLDDFAMHGRDWLALGVFLLAAAALFFLGRVNSLTALFSF